MKNTASARAATPRTSSTGERSTAPSTWMLVLDVYKRQSLCKEAGVILTDAGATFPYGADPNDSNIRVAPTFPPQEELRQAMHLLCICVRLAASEKLLSERV